MYLFLCTSFLIKQLIFYEKQRSQIEISILSQVLWFMRTGTLFRHLRGTWLKKRKMVVDFCSVANTIPFENFLLLLDILNLVNLVSVSLLISASERLVRFRTNRSIGRFRHRHYNNRNIKSLLSHCLQTSFCRKRSKIIRFFLKKINRLNQVFKVNDFILTE